MKSELLADESGPV